jgi:F-type H+-transporting ATPase subunit gamma
MAGLKELRSRLKSVKNTKKITYAMKLVSAAKLRKAQDAALRSREYAESLRQLLAVMQQAMVERAGGKELSFAHPLMERREVKVIRLIVVGGSRGLAGGYNSNLGRKIEAIHLQAFHEHKHVVLESITFGRKVSEHYRRLNRTPLKAFDDLPEDPALWPLTQVLEAAESDFVEGKIDAVYLVYTKFKSALSSTPTMEKLLPLDPEQLKPAEPVVLNEGASNILFEPSPAAVFAAVVPRIFRSLVLQGCLDSKASEHGSRMAAMDAATKNAGDLIHRLQLNYNKLRQSGITSELLDIIGGAEASG